MIRAQAHNAENAKPLILPLAMSEVLLEYDVRSEAAESSLLRDEQNSWKELPPNKANGNQKSLGHLRGAKTIAR